MNYAEKIIRQSNAWYNDGLGKAQIRDLSGAIVSLRRSLQYNRENIAARNLLGLVYYGRGEVAEALVEWIISKNLQPNDNIASEYIGKIQGAPRKLEKVNRAVKKYNQCLVYCEQEGEDMAILQLKKVTGAHPTFLKAYQLLALLYLHTEQYTKARQVLKKARELDTTNEITLRYIHELTNGTGKRVRKQGRHGSGARDGRGTVAYRNGNETIIQPDQSAWRFLAGRATLISLGTGVLIGAAIVWFLLAPAAEEARNAQVNQQLIDASERINALEAQVSAQTRTLDQYRNASGENTEQTAAGTADSYENLIAAYDQFTAGGYSAESLADTLLGISRDTLGGTGQGRYDEMTAAVYPEACQIKYAAGMESFNVANYENAINNLLSVVRMDESYESGAALLNLGLAYQRSGDNAAATTYLTRCNELFPDSENASQARTGLDEIAQATVAEE